MSDNPSQQLGNIECSTAAEVLDRDVRATLGRARAAAVRMRSAASHAKNDFVIAAAAQLREGAAVIAAANAADVAEAAAAGRSPAWLDRLRLGEDRLRALADATTAIAALPDPVGMIVEGGVMPNGLQIRRQRTPLGVIGVIYEARPGVTVDAAALAIKAGNAVILRGGSDARRTNAALLAALQRALAHAGLPEDAVLAAPGQGHDAVRALVAVPQGLDVAIPRGGTALIDAVQEAARVPVIQHYQGVCHVYLHADADLDQAVAIAVNAKAQRPGVCNAMEALLLDVDLPDAAVQRVLGALADAGVRLHLCERTLQRLARLGSREFGVPASPGDFGHEYLALDCLIAEVAGVGGAIAHIERYGSHHTEVIVCRDLVTAQRFVDAVDASCVLVNASTRFNDGHQLGLGAEIGISTTKLHAYGPMGLASLTAVRTVVIGSGQVRI